MALAQLSCSPIAIGPKIEGATNAVEATEPDFARPVPQVETLSQYADSIAAFYRARFYQPVWMEYGRLNRDGVQLLRALMNSDEQGIHLTDFGLPDTPDVVQPRFDEDAATSDRRFTLLFLRYARALRMGRIMPDDVAMNWAMERSSFDPTQILERLQQTAASEVLNEQAPPHGGYKQLVVALAQYRAIAASGGWGMVPGGPVLELGKTDSRVALLRLRLAREGYLGNGQSGGGAFDDSLERAVRTFQTRHGLTVDGRVGSETLSALNVPASARVAQIEVNMERWRWVPRQLPARRIEVNVAAAELTAFDQNLAVLTMRTIVGSRRHPSPLLQSAIQAVIVNPVWNVPVSITVNEMLPRLRREPDYLLKEGIQILDRPGDPYGLQIDWRRLPAGSRFLLQQPAGPSNALGRLKFDIPNRFDVYLHDTPAKALFDRSKRALSHGCIRLQHADQLAALLLGEGDERVTDDLATEQTVRIPLEEAMPVYLLYWTVFTMPDGQLHFRDDVYGHDARMLAALAGRATQVGLLRLSSGGCPIDPGVMG